jgi:hypothetical protein
MTTTALLSRIRSRSRVGIVAASVVCSLGLIDVGIASAAENAGALEVQSAGDNPVAITGGTGATSFSLSPPAGAACTGDTATDGYLVHSYMVPAAVDPATLTFEAIGPIPPGVGADFRNPLFAAVGQSPWSAQNTAPETGVLLGLVEFSFALFAADGVPAAQAAVPAGTYNIGLACTLDGPSPTQLDRYWNVQVAIAHDAADPVGLTWTVVGGTTPTTTTTTTTTVVGGTTTLPTPATTVPGVSTTSIAPINAPGASTTIPIGGTTTLPGSVAGGGGGGGTTGGSSTGSTTGTPPRALPSTGSTWVPFAFWAIVLLALGRIALLTARSVVVKRPPSA